MPKNKSTSKNKNTLITSPDAKVPTVETDVKSPLINIEPDTSEVSKVEKIKSKNNDTQGRQIWNSIKSERLDPFGFPATIEDYCIFEDMNSDKCHLVCKINTVIPMIENLLRKKFECELSDKHLIVGTHQ